MEVSITDRFLWDVYKFLEKAGDAADIALNVRKRRSFFLGTEDLIFRKYRNDKNKRKFNNLVYYLKRKGYIKAENLENKQGIMLTKQGIDKAFMASFKLEKEKKRKDGKWVMLIFDIPEKRRRERGLLRSVLRNLGYKLFQQSVWMTPYDVSNKTEKLLQMYLLDKYVRVFLIEEL